MKYTERGPHITGSQELFARQVFVKQLQKLHCSSMLLSHYSTDQLCRKLKTMLPASILNLHPIVITEV